MGLIFVYKELKRKPWRLHYLGVGTPVTLGSPYPWGTLPGPHVPQWAHPGLPLNG